MVPKPTPTPSLINVVWGLVPGGSLSLLYLVWALPLLLTLACVVPPWTNTDETFHMLRGVSLAHGHIVGSRFDYDDPHGPPGSGGLSDMAIFAAFDGLARLSWLPDQPNGEVTAAILARSDAVKWQRTLVPVWFGTTAQYPPFFYLPDVAGYWIGRAAGLHVNATLRLARCLNALLFAAVAAIAIARARRLRPLLMALLMLPMTIALGASANQDAGMIATMALVVAQLDRIAAEQRSARLTELAWCALGLGCIAAARPPYVALLAVLLTAAPGPPGRRAALVASAGVAAWCAVVAIFVMRPLNHADPAAQFFGLLADPAAIPAIAANTIRVSFPTYAWEFIGRLAWNDVPLPAWYLALAGGTLMVCAASSMAGHGLGRRTVLVASLFVIVGIFALLFLDWTPAGANHVEGVAGRHFIPLALAAGLALPTWLGAERLRVPAGGCLALLAAVTPAVMLHHVIFHFYVAMGAP